MKSLQYSKLRKAPVTDSFSAAKLLRSSSRHRLQCHREQLSVLKLLLKDARVCLGVGPAELWSPEAPQVIVFSMLCWLMSLPRDGCCHHVLYTAADMMVTTGVQVWFLSCITSIWSVCNLVTVSRELSVMRDYCKYPLNFCSFHIWRIIYLVFYNLPSRIFPPRLDCMFDQSSLLCRLLGILLSTSWKSVGSFLVKI